MTSTTSSSFEFRLMEFTPYNKQKTEHKGDSDDSEESDSDNATMAAYQEDDIIKRKEKKDEQEFVVQMFGLDDKGQTYSAFVEGFSPYFFVKVGDSWTQTTADSLLEELRKRVGKYYEKSIKSCKLVKKHKLYWFDAGKLHNFVCITFANTIVMNKVKNLFYCTALKVRFDPLANTQFASLDRGTEEHSDESEEDEKSEEEDERAGKKGALDSKTTASGAGGASSVITKARSSKSAPLPITTAAASSSDTSQKKMRIRTIVCSNIRNLPDGERVECTLTKSKQKMYILIEHIVNREQVLSDEGFEFRIYNKTTGKTTSDYLFLYESNIPPLLRLFHIQNLSPSGWVRVDKKHAILPRKREEKTNCHVEFSVKFEHIEPIIGDERKVPLKICSFDIEASSSHGDFPIPVKSYEKLAMQLINYWDKDAQELLNRLGKRLEDWSRLEQEQEIMRLINAAFVHMTKTGDSHDAISPIYTKRTLSGTAEETAKLQENIAKAVQSPIRALKFDEETIQLVNNITTMFAKASRDGEGGDDSENMQGRGVGGDDASTVIGEDEEEDVDENDDSDEDEPENDEEQEDEGDELDAIGIPKIKNQSQYQSVSKKEADVPFWMKAKTYVKVRSTIVDLLNDKKFDRQQKMKEITMVLQKFLPAVKGDTITFIGSTFMRFGEQDTYKNHCIVLDECESVADTEIECYKTEKEVLLAWTKLIQRENPDIIIGYNIFGFDYRFMFYRAKELNCLDDFLKLSRNRNQICGKLNEKTRQYEMEQSSITISTGTYNLEYMRITGRLQIDMLNYFRREFQLSSYKLDSVASTIIGDKVKSISSSNDTGTTTIKSKNLAGLRVGNYICFEEIAHSSDMYNEGEKFPVIAIDSKTATFVIKGIATPDTKKTVRWCMTKDDIDHHDIFRLSKGTSSDRAIVAKYCIQDCNLVHHLMNKVDVITGYIEMANLCSVPIDFLIMRGQGIKLQSFLAKQCAKRNTLMPVLQKKKDGGYEGAIVLPPKCDLYLEEPVACNDYSSLYPSSMISENLSHDSKVWTKEYDLSGKLIRMLGDEKYDNLPEYEYVDVAHDTYDWFPNSRGKLIKTLVGSKTCRFAQYPAGRKGILPEILVELLAARKATRKSIEFKTVVCKDGTTVSGALTQEAEDSPKVLITEKNGTKHTIMREEIVSIEDTYTDFMKNILDKRQLAYKVTANSMYGQCGARTSAFYDKDVAASTTAVGRMALTYGRRIIEEVYGDAICETKYGKVHTHATYIYGDTDSVFYSLRLTDLDGRPIVGKEALCHTIELGMEIGKLASKFLKPPHDWVYEKTFMPFILLSKKRYVGMLYEDDPEAKPYRKSMGIVLKRRDNAPIVKDVYGGAIDILMGGGTIQDAVSFTKKCLMDVVDEKYPLEKLIITKSLNSFYKRPESIAHCVLADRIGKREGNKPNVGDRIPFVYIETKGKVKLQGDKVEHPDFIRKNGIRPDYGFYITNQIMKPLQQLFALVLEKIPTFRHRIKSFNKEMEELRETMKDDEIKWIEKEKKIRAAEVKKLIFDKALRMSQNIKNKQTSLEGFFG